MDMKRSHGVRVAAKASGAAESGRVRLWLEEARRRIADAGRRGATEAVVPLGGSAAELDAVRRALGRGGHTLIAVLGEDGPYLVIYW